ncbi:MAG: AAA family ATPase [Candidatus Methanomethylicaceae archaeon]
MKNIRTYEYGDIEFPNGFILFEGDIGSGKSTILLAIEFALFGLGNEKGTTLLSLGKNEGEVELTFEVRGKEVKVHRSLVRVGRGAGRRGSMALGGVRQEDCWIEMDGRRFTYTPKEMKEAILKILGYNEPVDPKAKSVIFRYAVYTPQEEMKEILSRPPEERLQIIRKALRLEEYKVARDNSRIISKELRTNARLFSEEGKRLPEIEARLRALEEKKSTLEERAKVLEDELLEVEVEIRGYKEEIERIRSDLERLAGEAKREAELEYTLKEVDKKVETLNQRLKANKAKVEGIRREKEEILSRLKKPAAHLEVVEERLREVKGEFNRITEELGVKTQLFRSYSSLVEKKICPTCNQRVDNEEFISRVVRLEKEVKIARENRSLLEEELNKLEALREEIQEYTNESKRLEELEERQFEIEVQIGEDEQELKEFLVKRNDINQKIGEAKKAAEEYKRGRSEYERIEGRGRELEERRRRVEGERVKTITELKNIEVEVALLQQEIKRIKERTSKAERLVEYATWLDECFSPALEKIELAILIGANREFDHEFSRFFAFMVEDPTKSVTVDEDFTPIVTQEAYEQEVTNLSGGERTALALAYRLSLNKMVQRRSGVEGGLLIMDEPTDGLSKDQIGKIGDLIRELNPVQTIVVSHERELEGAVDHIFRVQKEDGKSRIHSLGMESS